MYIEEEPPTSYQTTCIHRGNNESRPYLDSCEGLITLNLIIAQR